MLAASYEAKAYGVRTAMGGRQALRLCPQAVVVPPRMRAYVEASKAVFRLFDEATPLVEGLSIDEAFLDVRGLEHISGTPAEIAARLRGEVRDVVGLPITVGVARTKFLAKVASGVAKPDGLLVVPPGGELAFLHPLPVERLWGVGPRTAVKLHARGIHTVGRVARLEEAALVAMLGRAAGRHLHAIAHNRDPRPVQPGRRRRSIGSQRALGRRSRSLEEIDATLVGLVGSSHPAHARRPPRRPHHRAAPAVRGLLARDPLDDAPARDSRDTGGSRRRPDAPRRGVARDRAARADARRHLRREHRGRWHGPARAAARRPMRATRSTRQSTASATASGMPPSRAASCSATIPARPCRCYRTDPHASTRRRQPADVGWRPVASSRRAQPGRPALEKPTSRSAASTGRARTRWFASPRARGTSGGARRERVRAGRVGLARRDPLPRAGSRLELHGNRRERMRVAVGHAPGDATASGDRGHARRAHPGVRGYRRRAGAARRRRSIASGNGRSSRTILASSPPSPSGRWPSMSGSAARTARPDAAGSRRVDRARVLSRWRARR